MTTIKDIARIAQVSKATVSLALAGDPRVAAATRAKVQAIAERMGYVPNRMASGLRRSSSRTIGVLFYDSLFGPTEELFKDALMGITQDALNRDYNVMLLSAEPSEEENIAAKVLRSGVEALIVISAAPLLRGFAKLHETGFPLVFLGKREVEGVEANRINMVATDNYGAGVEAADYFNRLGHRSRAVVVPEQALPWMEERAYGFMSRNYSFGTADKLPSADSRILTASTPFNPADPCWQKLADSPATAYFATSPVIGLTLLKYWQSRQINVPSDVTLLIFDDFPGAVLETPSLSVFKQEMKELGKLALQTALNRLDNKGADPRKLLVAAQLIERGSCASR